MQASYAQQPVVYPNARPAFPPAYSQSMQRPDHSAATPLSAGKSELQAQPLVHTIL